MTDFFNSVGMEYVVIGLAAALLLALILVIVALVKVGKLKKRYEKFLSGKDGKSLEESIVKRFDKLNDELCLAATNANHYGNTLMPIMHNIGNIFFVLLAIIGCFLAINNVPNLGVFFKNDEGKLVIAGMNTLTIGIIVAFLNMSRQFSQSVGQVSQQVSMVAMALAGAKRVFDFLDEKEEEDSGYVTLVYANKDQDGTITESPTRTGLWAWKHPHSDGTITYTQLKGDIVLNEVDFGYVPEKIVLHDVSIYARPGQKIAFVGATGAGKTTITNLINRFYDIQDGKIRYDGININKIKKDDYKISYILYITPSQNMNDLTYVGVLTNK